MARAWYIREWKQRYEVNEKGRAAEPGDTLRRGSLTYIRQKVNTVSEGRGYRRLRQITKTKPKLEACMCVFPKLLEMAADGAPEQRGYIRDEWGNPGTAENIAFYTGFRVRTVETAIEVLSDPRIRWIIQKALPESPGTVRESPLSDTDTDTDTESDTEEEAPAQTSEVTTGVVWTKADGWEGITDDHRARWGEAFPAVNTQRALAAMDVWLRANPKKAHRSNWQRFIVNWLRGNQDRGGDLRGKPEPEPQDTETTDEKLRKLRKQ